jgi:hypothetical protein
MSPVLFSAAAASVSTGWSTSQAPLDAHQAEDLYAVWNQIFSQERAVEAPAAPRGGNDSGEGGGAASACAVQRASAMAHDGGAASQGSSPERSADPSMGVAPVQQGLADSAGLEGTPGAEAATVVNATSQSALPADSFPLEGPAPQSTGEAALLAARVQPSSAEPLAAESVRVFVQGPAVAIVVRDATISDQDAVYCAFETARELTGLRSSLQQLTLNGRTLYQRHIHSDMREVPPCGAPVFFAC